MKEDINYVLKFALEVIENNDLQDTINNDNWKLGKSLEEAIDLTKEQTNVSKPLTDEMINEQFPINNEDDPLEHRDDIASFYGRVGAKWARDYNIEAPKEEEKECKCDNSMPFPTYTCLNCNGKVKHEDLKY